VLDVSGETRVTDLFVLVTGLSRPQVKAIYQELHVRLKAAGETHGRAEGVELGWWVLLDYGDVVVHLMQPEAREYYDLDGLYGEAEEIDWRSIPLPELPLPKHARTAD
jgi:ribosome-associated protein